MQLKLHNIVLIYSAPNSFIEQNAVVKLVAIIFEQALKFFPCQNNFVTVYIAYGNEKQ